MTRVGARSCEDGLAGHPLDCVEVVTWHGNYSAFNGYHFTPSDYSELRCKTCGASWRTKARYVERLS